MSGEPHFTLENSKLPARSVKITIPPALPVAPARVQPSRVNKANRMAEIMASIESDDDSAIPRPRLRKRRVIESDAEDMFNVPKDIERNPMAPVAKKRKRLHENPPHGSTTSTTHPPLLSLQPVLPVRIPPPGFQNPERPVSKARPGPQFQPPAPAPQPPQSQHQTDQLPDVSMRDENEDDEGSFLLLMNSFTQA